MARRWQAVLRTTAVVMGTVLAPFGAGAQVLGSNCTATMQNHSVTINVDGTFAIPNIPVDQGFYRVRVVCKNPDGTFTEGQSEFEALVAKGQTIIKTLQLGTVQPAPVSIALPAGPVSLNAIGKTFQLNVTGTLPDQSTVNLSTQTSGTFYSSSNARIASVSPDGLVTALSAGKAFITARNEGAAATTELDVLPIIDSDGDGMPDDWEIAHGLNPNDPSDANLDPDNDGLTNLQEFRLGTDPHNPDTDGDGISDGDEVKRGTNPLSADSDGDGLTDGDEIRLGTDPLNPDTDGDGIPDGIEVKLGLNPLQPDPTTTVQGHVQDAVGNAVGGASVVVFQFFVATSDSTGFFSIPKVPAGLGGISGIARVVRQQNLLQGASTPTNPVTAGITDLGTIQVGLNSGQLGGLVTDPQGRPTAGVQITVSFPPDVRNSTTDITGHYTVSGLPASALIITAVDPVTGLRARSSTVLAAGKSATADLRLLPLGTVKGTVFNRDQLTPVGVGIFVTLNSVTSTTTDGQGRYTFDFIPVGQFTVEAKDALGNRGRSTGVIDTTSQIMVTDVDFLPRGNVTGLVTDAAGNAVANAGLTLNGGSTFGGAQTTNSDATGHYSFNQVFIGSFTVTAQSALSRLSGQAAGLLTGDGQTVTANIRLTASGNFTGTVFRADGVTPVPGAKVSVADLGLSTVASSAGVYTLQLVPVGTHTLEADDPQSIDRGRISAGIVSQDQTVAANVRLNGLGTANVVVKDAAGNAVPSAQLALTTQGSFATTQLGTTQPDGTFTFAQVLAGPIQVSATDPLTQLKGTATGNVQDLLITSVSVNLQAAASVLGTVFKGDGVTPVSNINVVLSGQVTRSVTSASDGTFRFDCVPSGSYTLQARDGLGNTRARVDGVVVAVTGQNTTQNLQLTGTGSVAGVVIQPDGTPGPGILVTLQSQIQGFTSPPRAQTDVNGKYLFKDVPVGAFLVSASEQAAAGLLLGTSQGRITVDGDAENIDIQLLADAVQLPKTLYDANGFDFEIQPDGSIRSGKTNVFAGDSSDHSGGMVLQLISNGTTTPFTGAIDPGSVTTSELGGRQVILQQNGLAGLLVTRKIFVPQDGYFIRYLELLNNPGTTPVTVDVKLSTFYRFINKVDSVPFTFSREPRIITTSSGDALLDVSLIDSRDHWLVVDDDQDGDPFFSDSLGNQQLPSVAQVFDGGGAPLPISDAQYTIDFVNKFGEFGGTWKSITVAPGATAAILHFTSQEASRAGAQAAAARLVQLAPEAIAGLSPSELASIQNFNTAGAVTLDPLPPITGTVQGQAQAADGSPVPGVITNATSTGAPGGEITFKSNNLLYGRTYKQSADANGNFSFAAALNPNGDSLAIAVDGFTLQGLDRSTAVSTVLLPGSFAAGSILASQNVVFSSAGVVGGSVKRASGTVVSSGTVAAANAELPASVARQIVADGSYRILDLQPALYTLTAQISNPQGSPGLFLNTANITAGGVVTADIIVPATGEVTGVLRRSTGDIVSGAGVQMHSAGLSYNAATDTGGRFSFFDVPAGTFSLETYDAATNTAASSLVSVVGDQITNQDLTLTFGGTVTGVVSDPSNNPVTSAQVQLTTTGGILTTTSGTGGLYTTSGISPGPVLVQASTANGLAGQSNGSIGISGQTARIDLKLIAAGTVTGSVLRNDGVTPVSGAQVSISSTQPVVANSTTTDAQGNFTFKVIPIGPFGLTAHDAATGDFGTASGQISAAGEVHSTNVKLVGTGTVVATVVDAAGNLVANASLILSSASSQQSGVTQANGTATFNNVLAGTFQLTATDPVSQMGSSTSGTLAAGTTTSIEVHLQPSGTVIGQVLAADGKTPVSATVTAAGNGSRSTVSDSSGFFRLDGLALGAYGLTAIDASGAVRARNSSLSLTSNGQQIVSNLTFVAVGTVTGRVLNSDGSVAPNLSVSLQSANQVLGGFFNSTTDPSGIYRFDRVPAGAFLESSRDQARAVAGEANGQIVSDGQTVTLDIHLLSNAVNLPLTLHDGNNYVYDLQPNLSINTGSNFVFAGNVNSNRGAMFLDILDGATDNPFPGTTIGTQELSNQQIVVQQTVGNINVTRKVYVPQTGYFARYLEILSNPGTTDVQVTVKATSNFAAVCAGNSKVILTSSGDATLDVSDPLTADHWVVVDSNPSPGCTDIVAAVVFDGPGGQQHVGTAAFTNPILPAGQLSYQWTNVVVPAGQQVAFMHFAVQERDQTSAQAAAARLVQLPPEVLTGLTPAEIASIRNFAVPSDGTSTAPPLPVLNARITGHVLAADATTPIPDATVTFTSGNILFGSSRNVGADASGAFTIDSSSGTVPADSFVLTAVDIRLRCTTVSNCTFGSPQALGSFAPGQNSATQNVIYSNAGMVHGQVLFDNGAAVTSGSVSMTSNNMSEGAAIAPDGSFRFDVVPPSTSVFLNATATSANLTGQASVAIAAGDNIFKDVVMEPTGTLSGVVRSAAGVPVPGLEVLVRGTNYVIFTATDSSGTYLFPRVRLGTMTVSAAEPNTGIITAVQITISQNTPTIQDLTLIGVGQIALQVNLANGTAASGSTIDIFEASRNATSNGIAITDGGGRATINNVPVGSFTVTAHLAGQPATIAQVTGSVATNGAVVPVTITFQGTGTVTGTSFFPNGAPAANAKIQVLGINGTALTTNTDAAGNYTFSGVPSGVPFTVRAFQTTLSPGTFSPAFKDFPNNVIPANGATLNVNVTLPALATLQVSAQRPDGTAVLSGSVTLIHSASNGAAVSVGSLGANGLLNISNVPEGPFTVMVQLSNSSAKGATNGTILASNNGATVSTLVVVPFFGFVQGVILAADGFATVGRGKVEFVDLASGQVLSTTTADSTGFYSFCCPSPLTTSGFTIRAHSPFDPTVTASVNGNFTADNASTGIDVTLPVPVITGKISFADGVGVSNLFTAAQQVDQNGRMQTYFGVQKDLNGAYSIAVPNLGDFIFTAQDNNSGLTETQTVTVTSTSAATPFDMTLPANGTVSGTVFDASGAPVPNTFVSYSSDASVRIFLQTDATGHYSIPRAALGDFAMEAGDPTFLLFASATGTLVNPGDTAVVDFHLPSAVPVSGTIFESDGVTPHANATVDIVNFDVVGPVGWSEQFLSTDASGQFQTTIQPGLLHVSAYDQTNKNLAGHIDAVAQPNTPQVVNVNLGSSYNFDAKSTVQFIGTDNFVYDFDCIGELAAGGNTLLGSAFSFSYVPRVTGQFFHGCWVVTDPDFQNQQITYGPSGFGGLKVTRKIFVPTAGKFARYLEVLSNPTANPVSTNVSIVGRLDDFPSQTPDPTVFTAPADTANSYAITQRATNCCVVAHVFAGPNARAPLARSHFLNGDVSINFGWDVTVQPGGTIILMYFVAQRTPGDTSGATAQAQALEQLSDPDALSGMTSVERSEVVNFNVPQVIGSNKKDLPARPVKPAVRASNGGRTGDGESGKVKNRKGSL